MELSLADRWLIVDFHISRELSIGGTTWKIKEISNDSCSSSIVRAEKYQLMQLRQTWLTRFIFYFSLFDLDTNT